MSVCVYVCVCERESVCERECVRLCARVYVCVCLCLSPRARAVCGVACASDVKHSESLSCSVCPNESPQPPPFSSPFLLYLRVS